MKSNIKILFIVVVFLLVSSILTNYALAQEIDSDLDGIPDSSDRYPFDYDNDGMPDIWEKKSGLRYDVTNSNEDPDNDGIKNIDEYKQGTNPMVSDKTKEKVSSELLSPVERTMARGLIWVGVALFMFLVVIFILYRVHILRIFKFMHHVSREHFEQHTREHLERRKRPYDLTPPVYGRGPVLPARRFRAYPKARFVQRPIRREVLRPEVREVRRAEEEIERGKKPVYKLPKEEQIAYPREEGSVIPQYEEKKKDEDVFGRLSEHIHKYKKLEEYKYNEDRLKNW